MQNRIFARGWFEGFHGDLRTTALQLIEFLCLAPLYEASTISALHAIGVPFIGSQRDITFPGHAREVDAVYGFFNSGINSHYDVDQQLGRVRDPGEVKVWVCGRKNFFEIELDAVKLDLVQTGDAHPAVRG